MPDPDVASAEKITETTLDDLYAYLRRYALSDSLFEIARLNAGMRYGFGNVVSEGLSLAVMLFLNQHANTDQARGILFINLTRLARYLLLSGANDFRSQALTLGSSDLIKAINLVSTLYEKDVEGDISSDQDLAKVMGRIGQWQFPLQENRRLLIGRGQLLFFEIPEELPGEYDIEGKMLEYYGLGAFQFMACGFVQVCLCHGLLKNHVSIEVDELKQLISKDVMDRFIALSTGTPFEYKTLMRRDVSTERIKEADMFGLDPLSFMPAIKVSGRSLLFPKDGYVVPQPYYLVYRAVMGVFYLLADKEKQIGNDTTDGQGNAFRSYFGNIYREYVGRQLAQATNQFCFIDIDKDSEYKDYENKKPDFLVIADGICLMFEIKTTILTKDARTLFADQDILAAVKNNSFKKAVSQLSEFEAAILRKEFKDIRLDGIYKIIKFIVGFEDVYLINPIMLKMAINVYGSNAQNLQIVSISDIETIGTYFAEGDNGIISILTEKIGNSNSVTWPLSPYIIFKRDGRSIKLNPLLVRASDKFFQRLGATVMKDA